MTVEDRLDVEIEKLSSHLEAVESSLEKSSKERLEQHLESINRLDRAIEQLDELSAEHNKYQQMNPLQQFIYRLVHRPSWL